MSTKVLHFFPLIGGAYLGTEFLAKTNNDIENMPIAFSISGAKKNEAPLVRNRNLDIKYIDELYTDNNCDCVTCNSKSTDFTIECKLIERVIEDYKHIISQANIIASIPPCNSLCMLNSSKKSRCVTENKSSQIMLRCTEFAVKSGIEKFVFENAPALIGKDGKYILFQIEKLCDKYGYSMTLLKTNSKYHSQGQKRERAFVYLFKGKNPDIIKFNASIEDMLNVMGNFDENGKITKPTTWQQELLSSSNSDYTIERYPNQDEIYNVYEQFFGYFNLPVNSSYKKLILVHDFENKLNELERTNYVKCNTPFEEKILKTAIKTSRRVVNKIITRGGGYRASEPLPCLDKDCKLHMTNGINGTTLGRYVHPIYKRQLSFTDDKRLMGIPDDFSISSKEQLYITQNVPAITFMKVIGVLLDQNEKASKKICYIKISGKNKPIFTIKEYDDVQSLPF